MLRTHKYNLLFCEQKSFVADFTRTLYQRAGDKKDNLSLEPPV